MKINRKAEILLLVINSEDNKIFNVAKKPESGMIDESDIPIVIDLINDKHLGVVYSVDKKKWSCTFEEVSQKAPIDQIYVAFRKIPTQESASLLREDLKTCNESLERNKVFLRDYGQDLKSFENILGAIQSSDTLKKNFADQKEEIERMMKYISERSKELSQILD